MSYSRFRHTFLVTLFVFFFVYCLYFVSRIEKKQDKGFPDRVVTKASCLTSQVLRNTDPNHTQAHLKFWKQLTPKALEPETLRWQRFITHLQPPPAFQGQGLVFVAGNGDTFDRALTTLRILRERHGCTLPVEIWHLHDEPPSPKLRSQFTQAQAVTRDLSDPLLPRPITHRRKADKQFQIKAAAIINSAFKEVLYLDSDNIPTQDPTFLFNSPSYTSTGALFWPDFWKTHGENKIFEVMQVSCQDEWEQESGQMVIDKSRAWLPLQLAWYMQSRYEIYFQFLNGDKDSFRFAWKALDTPFAWVDTFLGMSGTMVQGRFCGHTMVQYAPGTEHILFMHANLLKITDRQHFLDPQGSERPWALVKRSTFARQNTFIKPEFYISGTNQACMDFTHREGEPEAVTEDLDLLLPHFQKDYFDLGGIGGETRQS